MKRELESEEVEAPSRFVHSEEWIAAFRREYNTTMVRLIAGYAEERSGGIGPPSETNVRFPRALVVKALTDTFLGNVRWDPATPLDEHIQRVIRQRSQIDWKRASRRAKTQYRHIYIDATTATGRLRGLEELDRFLVQQQDTSRENAEEALEVLRQCAAEDPELLAYIDAWKEGGSRTEVMDRAGLSPTQYRQVRRRFVRLIKQLPFDARPSMNSEESKP